MSPISEVMATLLAFSIILRLCVKGLGIPLFAALILLLASLVIDLFSFSVL